MTPREHAEAGAAPNEARRRGLSCSATRARTVLRLRYERRLRVLLNRQDWAEAARDRALDRLDRVRADMARLEAEYADALAREAGW